MIYRDHFQNYKSYGIPKAQLIIADIPYNLGNNAYASNPSWYEGGDNKNGESDLAGTSFFDTDEDFRPAEFMHFCSTMLKPEPKKIKIDGIARQKSEASCMIIFCAFDQQMYLIELGKRYGLNNYINLVFRKNFSAQVLKANMKIVGNAEYGLVLYRDRLPKFRNKGKMIFNVMEWERDGADVEKLHPTQKPIKLLENLISIFTDEGDVVIDPVAGSGSTLIAAERLNRKGYGFEIKKDFWQKANQWLEREKQIKKDILEFGYPKTKLKLDNNLLFA